MKFIALFLVLFISIVVNLPEGYIARLGIDPDYLTAALVAIAMAGLTVKRHLALIVLVVIMSMGANLTESTALRLGINTDFMLAGLIAIVLLPHLVRWTGIDT